jgi:hypothetical protein
MIESNTSSVIPAEHRQAQVPEMNLFEHSLASLLSLPAFGEVNRWRSELPTGYGSCAWRRRCKAGSLEYRLGTCCPEAPA